jgi:methylenetetrahydrofolate--tRNA-(uracil-5-)-methyltransferase
MVHRNTYINAPAILLQTWRFRCRPSLLCAGQLSGVEGYVESTASGLIAGRNAAALARGQSLSVPPRTTAVGALGYYVSHADPHNYQPANITFGIMEPLPPGGARVRRPRLARNTALATRALDELRRWADGEPGGAEPRPDLAHAGRGR